MMAASSTLDFRRGPAYQELARCSTPVTFVPHRSGSRASRPRAASRRAKTEPGLLTGDPPLLGGEHGPSTAPGHRPDACRAAVHDGECDTRAGKDPRTLPRCSISTHPECKQPAGSEHPDVTPNQRRMRMSPPNSVMYETCGGFLASRGLSPFNPDGYGKRPH